MDIAVPQTWCIPLVYLEKYSCGIYKYTKPWIKKLGDSWQISAFVPPNQQCFSTPWPLGTA